MLAYHGSKAVFDTFSSMNAGQRGLQHGGGFYFTTTFEEASGFGKYVYTVQLSLDNTLDFNTLTDEQLAEFSEYYNPAGNESDNAGFGTTQYIDVTDMDREEAIQLFMEMKEFTSGYRHDRAKAIIEKDGDSIYIKYMDPTTFSARGLYDYLYSTGNFDSLRGLGYDSLITGSHIIVLFSPSVPDKVQIVSRDEVG